MLSPKTIAEALKCSRSDFAYAFLQAQARAGITVKDRIDMEVVTKEGKDALAFEAVLNYLQTKRKIFKEFVGILCRKGYENGELLQQIKAKGVEGKAWLEGITPGKGKYDRGSIFSKGSRRTLWTGKVLIKGDPKGSGVLIGPDRFLTAWHVVQDMFDPVAGGNSISYVPKKRPPKLEIMFDDIDEDDMDGGMPPLIPKKVPAAKDWLEIFSSSHADELDNQKSIPDNLDDLKKYLDYVIIRLDEPMDRDRYHATLDPRAIVPDYKEDIWVLQYPQGNRLMVSKDKITTLPIQIPDARFLHVSPTDHGSSGGPCFDRDFFLVGIHQGQWPAKKRKTVINRGIPIRHIYNDIEQQKNNGANGSALFGSNPSSYFVWYLDNKEYSPVMGLDFFQKLVLDLARSDKGNILTIQGEPKAGKSYCVKTLHALLNPVAHCRILIHGEEIAKLNVVELAKAICHGAGDDGINFESAATYNSTKSAWLKDEVTQRTLACLDRQRLGKLVWISFENLNKYDFLEKDVEDLILLLGEATMQNPWLQLVLDGWRTPLPGTLSGNRQNFHAGHLNETIIREYIQRFFKELKLQVDPMMPEAFSTMLYTSYARNIVTDASTALEKLNLETRTFLLSFMKKISNGTV